LFERFCGNLRILTIDKIKLLLKLSLDEQREDTYVNEEHNRKGKPKSITIAGVDDVNFGHELKGDQAGDHHLNVCVHNNHHQSRGEVLVHSVLLIKPHKVIIVCQKSHNPEEETCYDNP
jgi:hypothetical protein